MTTIYYFSATGNSLVAAKKLAELIPDCELVSIATAINTDCKCASTCVGFVFPVYLCNVPNIVERFARKLTVSKDTYIFAVVTCGDSEGNALALLDRVLGEKDLFLTYHDEVVMPPSYVVIADIDVSKAPPIIEEAKKQLVQTAANINARAVSKAPTLIETPGTPYLSKLRSEFPGTDENLNVSDACDSCGMCVAICPVENIKMVDGKPVFEHRCEHCMACLNWCPLRAINYKDITIDRSRYQNPEVTLEEMLYIK